MKRALILAALVAGSAHAEFLTGNMLLARMNGDNLDQIYAIGYVAGVADAGYGVAWCPPNAVTTGQVVDMTKALLEKSPADRHRPADVFVRAVTQAAFPCSRQERRGGGAV